MRRLPTPIDDETLMALRRFRDDQTLVALRRFEEEYLALWKNSDR
jgi:hypothetical protein